MSFTMGTAQAHLPALAAVLVGGALSFSAVAQTNGLLKYNSSTYKFQGFAAGVWVNMIPHQKYQVFTGNGTFTTPVGTTSQTIFKFTVVGGGGGGALSNGSTYRCGGSAGGTAIYYGSGVNAGTNVTVTVGGGGAEDTNGSNSSIVFNGTTVTANGGLKGVAFPCPAGGTATNGTINIQGGAGRGSSGSAAGGNGGASTFGGGGGGSGLSGCAGTNNATDGGAPGSGGGSACPAAATSGSGAAGIVIVEWNQ